MKIVIIGGGVAGLAFGSIMLKKGHQVVINEKGSRIPLGGNAFMMHEEGIEILKDILHTKSIPGSVINSFTMKTPDDKVLLQTDMGSWQCMKRADLISALVENIEGNHIKYDRAFSHFIYDGNVAVAAVFENGSVETGDLFVGSDGCHSLVRQLLFGETLFTSTEVREVLGTLKNAELVKEMENKFTKFQHPEKGISFGFIPVSTDEIVWFNQYDIRLEKDALQTKEEMKAHSLNLLEGFPEDILKIVKETPEQNFYLWNTKDFDPLPAFHSGNIVLVGDAAHVALPFTSAGTTNALLDAKCLSVQLEKHITLTASLNAFYEERIGPVSEHVLLGRNLKTKFLHPEMLMNGSPEIPLIKNVINNKEQKKKDKLEIVYFTDPICSTCWTIQPELRMLKLFYSESISLKYVMGGLLPSWENFNRGGITKPSDVATHWFDVSRESGMPIDGIIWNESPLHSSYPSAIAFKAAQFQGFEKSMVFLRRLNELVFMEGQNIANEDVIRTAALQAGLDTKKLIRDFRFNAFEAFAEDIIYTKRLNVDILPTFLLRVNNKDMEMLHGAQSFETFEDLILKHAPQVSKGPPIRSPMDVFCDYPSITRHEFSFLTQTNDEDANKILNELVKQGMVVQHKTRAGSVFLSTTKNGAFFI